MPDRDIFLIYYHHDGFPKSRAENFIMYIQYIEFNIA